MPFRIIMYFLITVWLLYLIYSINWQKEKEFAQTLRLFLTSIVVVLGGLALADYGVKQEKADHYDADRDLRRFKSLADIDPNMLNGIENIPPHAKIKENYDSTYLVAPKGQFFTWGPFRLNTMPLESSTINFNEKQLVHHLSQPININGIECETRNNITLYRKKVGTSGMHFTDFKLYNCAPTKLELHLENEKVEFSIFGISFYDSREGLLEYDKGLQPVIHRLPSMQKLLSAYESFRLVTQDGKNKLRLDVTGSNIIADINGNILLEYGKLYNCEQGNCAVDCSHNSNQPATLYQLGDCEYPQRINTYVMNFKQGKADWYFETNDEQKPLAEECKMQRLPYFIEPINGTK